MNRFELNSSGVRALLKSSEMKEAVSEKAEEIAARCGDGYSTDVKYMTTRVIASVFTDSEEAYKDNLENNTLLKAVQ